MSDLSYDIVIKFDLHENEPEGRIHLHMNGVALRLVMKQRHKVTRKWPCKSYDNVNMA